MMKSTRWICVFCGSRMGANPRYAEVARELGEKLAARGWGLVYGGGHVGLMGVVADAVLRAGGEVIGVIPQSLVDKELAHDRVTQLHITNSMHERKALMADLSQGFLALPGGFGTMDELCEIVTWAQLNFHQKPVAILDVDDYYRDFLRFVQTSVEQGFVPPAQATLLRTSKTVDEALKQVADPG